MEGKNDASKSHPDGMILTSPSVPRASKFSIKSNEAVHVLHSTCYIYLLQLQSAQGLQSNGVDAQKYIGCIGLVTIPLVMLS